MLTAEEMEPAGHVHVNTGRLWAGGIATAIVAALAVLAGVLITRGVLGIPVLAPKAASDFGDSSTAVYAGLAAGCAAGAPPGAAAMFQAADPLMY